MITISLIQLLVSSENYATTAFIIDIIATYTAMNTLLRRTLTCFTAYYAIPLWHFIAEFIQNYMHDDSSYQLFSL